MKFLTLETSELRMSASVKLPKEWLVDYQPARERAIRWLGERYLLARDVPRVTPRLSAGGPSSFSASGAGTLRPQRL